MFKSSFIIPKNYKETLSLKETQTAIQELKAVFEKNLAKKLHLTKVCAPLFVFPQEGLNDDLNGVENPVSFKPAFAPERTAEIVHSLAKWKRMALHRYDFKHSEGIYTIMNAIRKEEDLSNMHSIYVDQWDWEMIISKEEQTEEFLKKTVNTIYSILKDLEGFVLSKYPNMGSSCLAQNIHFTSTQALEDRYPHLSPKEREHHITKEHGAVFVMKIGDQLQSGHKHDGRAPDYDNWQLNGDILLWYPVLECAFEISSMGIRVDEKSLKYQLEKSGNQERSQRYFHQMVLKKELPLTLGGGIGQSRVCMYFLRKAHIGQVQASLWDENTIEKCKLHQLDLL